MQGNRNPEGIWIHCIGRTTFTVIFALQAIGGDTISAMEEDHSR